MDLIGMKFRFGPTEIDSKSEAIGRPC